MPGVRCDGIEREALGYLCCCHRALYVLFISQNENGSFLQVLHEKNKRRTNEECYQILTQKYQRQLHFNLPKQNSIFVLGWGGFPAALKQMYKIALETLFSRHTSHMINSRMLLLVKTTKTMTGSSRTMVCFGFLVCLSLSQHHTVSKKLCVNQTCQIQSS